MYRCILASSSCLEGGVLLCTDTRRCRRLSKCKSINILWLNIVYILSTHFHSQFPALKIHLGLVTVLFGAHMTLNARVCTNAVPLHVVGLNASGEKGTSKIQTVQYVCVIQYECIHENASLSIYTFFMVGLPLIMYSYYIFQLYALGCEGECCTVCPEGPTLLPKCVVHSMMCSCAQTNRNWPLCACMHLCMKNSEISLYAK